jgi:ribonuclease P protein component
MRLYTLQKKQLLTKGWQYQHVYKLGRRIRTNGVTFIYAPNSIGQNRLGISVSGIKSAVKRNRTKRLIREFYRFNPLFPSAIAGTNAPLASFDLVIATNKRFTPEGLDHLKTVFFSFLPAGYS